MHFVGLLLIGLYSVNAKLEDFDGLEELMNNPNLMYELEKRLGAILAEDGLDSEEKEVELPCDATNGTLRAEQSSCGFDSDSGLIIKTTESLTHDALFVGKTENVQCARDCAMQCCNNSKCDTAVYQNKDSHKCYLFKCSFPGRGNVCVFDIHSNYSVSYMRSRSINNQPGSGHVSHENDLENLGSHLLKPEPVVTAAPTTVESIPTTTVKPGLGETCSRYGAKCLDPHAECYMRECSCRAGYHDKYGICQRLCRKEEFECINEGLSPRAKQCVHESLLCDGNRDCDDGSDEYISNCPKIDEDNQPGHNTDKQASNYKPKGPVESPELDHADQAQPVQPPQQSQDTGTDTSGTHEGSQKNPDNNHPAPGPKLPEVPHSHSDDIITTLAPIKNNQDNSETENQLPDEDSKNSNNSESGDSEENQFTFFSSEVSEKVESYTDGSQGPIVALALGLAITLILLIFVGCRLRTVKRRLRKGRALHSNEADYLINGMYL